MKNFGIFLNLHKPRGVTSHDCVDVVRKLLGTKKVGHCGTLDPMATGVLPIAIGRATRFIQFLSHHKEYDGVIRFGLSTSSDDITGDIIAQSPVPWLDKQHVVETLLNFLGETEQVPPMLSALQFEGKRMYKLARSGMHNLTPRPRKVHVENISILNFASGDYPEASIRIKCRKGTYIRSIARDCGTSIRGQQVEVRDGGTQPSKAGIGATLAKLVRRRSSNFLIENSITMDDLRLMPGRYRFTSLSEMIMTGHQDYAFLTSIENVLSHLPSVRLLPDKECMYATGHMLTIPKSELEPVEAFIDENSYDAVGPALRIFSSKNELLGVSLVSSADTGNENIYAVRKRCLLRI